MERQFVCGTCGRRFSRADNMRQHQKKLGHHLAPYTRSRGGRLKLIKNVAFEPTLPRIKAFPKDYENENATAAAEETTVSAAAKVEHVDSS